MNSKFSCSLKWYWFKQQQQRKHTKQSTLHKRAKAWVCGNDVVETCGSFHSRWPWAQNLALVELSLTLYPFIQSLGLGSRNYPPSSMWKSLFPNVYILKVQVVMPLSKWDSYILNSWINTDMQNVGVLSVPVYLR